MPRHATGFSLSGCGLAHVVGGDARHLVDATVDLRDLGCDVQQVIDADRNREIAVGQMARRLVGRFDVDERFVAAEYLLCSGTRARDLADMLGVDRRRFVPAFRSVVGLAPKHYERLGRFQRAGRRLRSGNDEPLASIAFDVGFADQAHMTREVRRLTGRTPSQLQILPPGPTNHIPIAAGSA